MLVEAGTKEMDDDDWSSVTLSSRWGQDPKVISHCQTYRDGDPVVTRQKAPPYWVRNYPRDPPEVALRLQGVGSYPEHGTEEVGYLAVGNALQTDAVMTEETMDEQWTWIDFNRAFGESPVTLASIQTYNGSDAATVRFDKWGPYGVTARIDEPYGTSSPLRHSNEEAVGCVALERGAITDTDGADIGFAGTGSIRLPEQGSNYIEIDTSHLENPVAFAQVLTDNGGQSCHTRLDWDGGRSKVKVAIEEWGGWKCDDHHTREVIGYVVLEAGTHQLDDGMLVHVDTLETDRSWAEATYPEAVADSPVREDPPIITRCQTKQGGDPVVTRQSRTLGVNDHSFFVRLQEEDERYSTGDQEPFHGVERIGYLVAGSPLRLDAGRAANRVDHTRTSSAPISPTPTISHSSVANWIPTTSTRSSTRSTTVPPPTPRLRLSPLRFHMRI
ncbi:hypothetical protein [Halobaculum sp. EA56]|uniref:hypothetical protein n=1 Tax=Halobaculum sp. EA56 TaxID=3421648 RepID=UPI003EBFA092